MSTQKEKKKKAGYITAENSWPHNHEQEQHMWSLKLAESRYMTHMQYQKLS